jgi:hypothetical protein
MINGEKLDWLINILQEVKRGKILLRKNNAGEWYRTDKEFPIMSSHPSNWKIEEFPKPVDLSVLIETSIDCEFSTKPFIEDKAFPIGKLKKVSSSPCFTEYVNTQDIYWTYCRPRMHEWLVHRGDMCPVPEGVLVKARTFEGIVAQSKQGKDIRWKKNGNRHDIINFKVVGLAEGYCWPWEK